MSVRFGVSVLLKCLLYVRVSKGSRGTCMRLLRLKLPVVMNLKKIQQLMKKYNLRCSIRKPNPYRRIAGDMKTGYVAPGKNY